VALSTMSGTAFCPVTFASLKDAGILAPACGPAV